MRAPRIPVASAAAVLALTASACSGGTDDEGASERAPGRSDTKGKSPSSPSRVDASPHPAEPSPNGKDANCLFTVAEVSEVLGGAWKRRAIVGKACTYRSDRGAYFATNRVDDDIDGGLIDARRACMPGIKPIQISEQTFVCVEDRKPDDYVVGNTASDGTLWIAVIVPPHGSVPKAQISAMTALMGAVPD